jgi:large subunit ribosomal protein L3
MLGFGKKIGMTRLFVDGQSIPVTAIHFGEQFVLQKKTLDKDGYNAVQVAAYPQKNGTQARLAHIAKYNPEISSDFHCLEEFDSKIALALTTNPAFSDFTTDDVIDVSGTSKGKGFAGAIKRWGFHGQPKSRGHDHVRAVGSIGARWPQRVPAGKKMAGRMGGETVTIKKAKIVALDSVNNLIFVKGSIPGPNSNYLRIQKNN